MDRPYRSIIVFAIIVLALSACSSLEEIQLDKRSSAVRIGPYTPLNYSCRGLAEIYSSASGDPERVEAIMSSSRKILKRRSAMNNGNFVRIDSEHTYISNNLLTVAFAATAYSCHKNQGSKEKEDDLSQLPPASATPK